MLFREIELEAEIDVHEGFNCGQCGKSVARLTGALVFDRCCVNAQVDVYACTCCWLEFYFGLGLKAGALGSS